MTASRTFSRSIALALAGLLWGCGSQVIPGMVVEGTTATIAIPYDFDVGYGRAWAGNPTTAPPAFDPTAWNSVEDLQRGELIFILYEIGGTTERTKLAVRYITRVSRDPSSIFSSYATENHSQPIAFLDIPYGLVNDNQSQTFEIEVRRYRRDPDATPPFNFELVPQSYWSPTDDWWGWGNNGGAGSQQQRIPITVMDSPDDSNGGSPPVTNRYTPIEAWGPYGARGETGGLILPGIFPQYELDLSIPSPEFRIQIPAAGAAPPFAWEMQLTYPAERMRIFDVRLLKGNPSGAIATWKASPSPPSSACPGLVTGTLDLGVVDPQPNDTSRARGVAVIFHLVNQDDSDCNRRVAFVDVDFVPGSYRGYDVNGNLLTGAQPFQILDYDFH